MFIDYNTNAKDIVKDFIGIGFWSKADLLIFSFTQSKFSLQVLKNSSILQFFKYLEKI